MTRAALLALTCLAAAPALAETRTYVLAIGNNALPVDTEGERLEPLRYADDDAADFFTFARDFSHSATLLTVLDAPSQRRFPELAELARPPSLAELRRVVARLKERFEADVKEGHDPVLLFFFSGHGTRGGKRPPALAMLDQPLTQQILYDEILAPLPARYVHLLVDACHAEAVVRPRDLEAQPIEITDEDVQVYAARSTLERFPQVGAVLATASGVQAHEWDVYQRGVFSHELVSALRGAADINGDGKIEYSELSAFLGAANREVSDPRARLAVLVRPPSLNRRAALVDVARLRGTFRLVGRAPAYGELYVEDALGNRIVDFHAEPGHRVQLALPSERALFVHHRGGEAPLRSAEGTTVSLERIRFAQADIKARGALDSALQRGLFATAYGPRYYRGYVDQNQELTPVPVPDPSTLVVEETPPETPSQLDEARRENARRDARARRDRRIGTALLGVGGGLAVFAVIFGAITADAFDDHGSATTQRTQFEARERALAFEATAWVTAGAALVAGGLGTWLLVRGRPSAPSGIKLSVAPSGAGVMLRAGW